MNGGHSQSARVLADATRDLRLNKLARRSFSDLHFHLGKAAELVPGKAPRSDGSGGHIDTSDRHFDGLTIGEPLRSTPVIDALLEEARAADPDFDAKCQAEWEATDVPALLAQQVAKRKGQNND